MSGRLSGPLPPEIVADVFAAEVLAELKAQRAHWADQAVIADGYVAWADDRGLANARATATLNANNLRREIERLDLILQGKVRP